MSTSFHPETDGGSERTNKTIVQTIRYMVDQHQKGWVAKLPRVPFRLHHDGQQLNGILTFAIKNRPIFHASSLLHWRATSERHPPAETTAHQIIRQIELDVKEAQDNLLAAKIRQAYHANQHRALPILYIRWATKSCCPPPTAVAATSRRGRKRAAKFMPQFDGPYTVTDAFPERSMYTLYLPNNPTAFPGFSCQPAENLTSLTTRNCFRTAIIHDRDPSSQRTASRNM